MGRQSEKLSETSIWETDCAFVCMGSLVSAVKGCGWKLWWVSERTWWNGEMQAGVGGPGTPWSRCLETSAG
jgi:hypothetical protein